MDPIISTSARFNPSSSQRCSFHSSQAAFVLPPSHPFLQGLGFLNQVSILLMGSLSILFCQCSYPVILRKILTELQVYHSSFSFLLRWLQFKLSVLIIFPSSFQVFSYAGVSLNHSPLAFHVFRIVEDISFKSFNSTGAISFFKLSFQRCFFWVGPNPQVFSQDLTWLF